MSAAFFSPLSPYSVAQEVGAKASALDCSSHRLLHSAIQKRSKRSKSKNTQHKRVLEEHARAASTPWSLSPGFASNLLSGAGAGAGQAPVQDMNVIYIRSYPTRPQEIDGEDCTSSSSSSSEATDPLTRRRKWRVSIRVNDDDASSAVLEDPFLEVQYRSIFEQYLRSSDRPRWSSQALATEEEEIEDIELSESMIREYGENLFAQLELQTGLFTHGDSEAQLYVVEHYDNDQTAKAASGVHCLAWELLESVQISRLPKLRLRVTRISDFPARRLIQPMLPAPQRLAAVQADPNATFKILLVIARDFSRSGAGRDPEPDLAQWPLMNLQKKLRSRLTLEVVRPGSLEELERHLEVRAKQNVEFNLVHFDLHGRIMRDETGVLVPWLLFARQHTPQTGYSIPQTQLAKAESVAVVLARFQIENVVLNACLSAYNRSGPTTNLAHIFLRHGISNVSAMWFYVHFKTVATYVEAFYRKLLVKCLDFHVAAQRGREALRRQPTNHTGHEYNDFFLCVNYARNVHRTDSMVAAAREASPAPSTRSHDSSTSTSNNSLQSVRSGGGGGWKSSAPRIGDSLILTDEPIMRLQLHLLELEYKLMTFRIVYASDLHQAGSDLGSTMDRMVNMWLNTNLVDEVMYYKAKDFGRRRFLSGNVSPREKRTRATNGGYLQLLFPKSGRALRQALHIVREVDAVVDPGWQTDEPENQRREERRVLAQEGLQRFADKLHQEGNSYMIFLGSQNAQWWRSHLQHLDGDWWLHMPWSFTVHSRYTRDAKPARPVVEC